jgi:hypothetical protein
LPVVMLMFCPSVVSLCAGCAFEVGNKPNPVSSVGSVDGTSWKYKRLYFVPLSFQVSLHLVEYHPSIPTNKAANVFAHNPCRLNFPYCSKHFGPEMALIFFTKPLSGVAVGLA